MRDQPQPSLELGDDVGDGFDAGALVADYLQALDASGRGDQQAGHASAAHHLLRWLADRRIAIASVDAAVIARFARHRCRCGRYSPRELARGHYISRVRRFVGFLEDRGLIAVADDLGELAPHLAAYDESLASEGYGPLMRGSFLSDAEHLHCWLRVVRLHWRDVDDEVLDRYAAHDCVCPIGRKRGTLKPPFGPARRRRGAARFLRHLQSTGAVPVSVTPPKSEDPRLSAFRDWLTRRRGLSAETLRRYVQEAGRWLDTLGDGMSGCEAGRVRAVVLDQAPERSRSSIRMTTTVLRAYLRFRVAAGEVRPALVDAVPTAPRRRLATIPRYVPPAVIERIVASTAGADAAAVRDRAIILLLARLGLRAGDLWRLTLGDLDWERGEMLLHGKGGLRARMPLPQDAGDALLAYIETTRPRSLKARIFLRLQPPHRPFASSAEIAGIVARVLKRGGFSGVPSGSHMFRHSLATSMLRGGASLDSVGVVLRHRHPSTTAIYAKADVAMLTRIAQPWPGDASC